MRSLHRVGLRSFGAYKKRHYPVATSADIYSPTDCQQSAGKLAQRVRSERENTVAVLDFCGQKYRTLVKPRGRTEGGQMRRARFFGRRVADGGQTTTDSDTFSRVEKSIDSRDAKIQPSRPRK
uniref:Uncharacterized protein n=1 Tax=Plectus sambesii TaxID=2011161 RepID=A0A914WS83_9BILA